MTYFRSALTVFISIAVVFPSWAGLKEISDNELSSLTGQAGITIDRSVPLSVDSIVLDLEGSDGVSVITGDRLDADSTNDRAVLNYHYSGLTLDVLAGGILSIGFPDQFILGEFNSITGELENGLNASFYLSDSAEITPTTYSTQQQTYTAYINSVSDDPEYDDFTLSLDGANFNSTGNGTFSGSYQENESNSNIDGASATFTVTDAGTISISVTSSDRTDRVCNPWPFCSGDNGTDDGEIIIVDENGDLVAYSSQEGEDASLIDLNVGPTQVVDSLGSNFFLSAKMVGTFDLTGHLNVFSGTVVEHRP